MAAGRRDLQRALGGLLSHHVGEVERRRRLPRRTAPAAAGAGAARPPARRSPGRSARPPPPRAPPPPRPRGRWARAPPARGPGPGGPRWPAGARRAPARTSPDSASSPTMCDPGEVRRDAFVLAASRATAMGRSNPVPSLRRSPGARFTVTCRAASSSPAFRIAACTRTFASCTALVASPTMWMPGIPPPASTSTSTGMAVTPSTVPERMRTSMQAHGAGGVPAVRPGKPADLLRSARSARMRRGHRSAERTRVYPASSTARRITASNIAGVSRPVCVFCCDGW